MNVLAVIPARFGSTRFPGKPLARETGKYLIQHVVERVRIARTISRTLIATDDARIAAAAREFGAECVMTRSDHVSGTDRIAEAVVALAGGDPRDIVLNVQGDEPEIEPAALDQLVRRMQAEPALAAGTLACPFPAESDPSDPNRVKVVRSRRDEALYFSRARIPFPREAATDAERVEPLLHLGVYAYRREFLLEFARWPASPLEQTEKLEQLRILEYGVPMAVEIVQHAPAGVDTPDDYRMFVQRWRNASLEHSSHLRGTNR